MNVVQQFEDARIQVFHKENGGLSDARNYGLDKARGEFIYFMDSDDWIEPQLLKENIAILEGENLDVIVFGYIQDDEDANGIICKSTTICPPKRCIQKGEDKLPIDTHLLGILGYAWNKIYRKSFLDQNKLIFEKGTSLVEDILFNSQVYQKVDKLYFNNVCYYHYLNRPVQTLIKKFHANSFELKKRKIEVVDQFLKDWFVEEVKRDQMKSIGIVGGIRYCINNLYAFKNELTVKEKKHFIKRMLNDPLTKKFAKYYPAKTKKDILYKLMIQNKANRLIASMASIIK